MATNQYHPPLSPAQIEELREFDTPTIANAIELIDPSWDRVSGIMEPRIRSLFPEKKPLVGYATTLLSETRHPATSKKFYVNNEDYWRHILTVPEPRVSVCQDISPPPSLGSLWGEVQANIHMALGCVGAILEGGVRDLDPIQRLDYPCFAREVNVGHAYGHIVDCGHPVEVGGVVVCSGDLIHADLHGVIVIPNEAAPQLAEHCRRIFEMERPVIELCSDHENFTLEQLIETYEQFAQEYPELDAPTE